MIKMEWHQEVVDALLLIKLLEILMHLSPGGSKVFNLNGTIFHGKVFPSQPFVWLGCHIKMRPELHDARNS
jgi:hypothetical protein